MTNSCDDPNYFNSQPSAEIIAFRCSSDWPSGHTANWPTWTSQCGTDTSCDAWITDENALGLNGMHRHVPAQFVGDLDCLSASITSNLGEDQVISTSPSFHSSRPENRGQLLQPPVSYTPLIHPELALSGAGEAFSPYWDSLFTPAEICPVLEPLPHSQSKHVGAARVRAAHSRYTPYALGHGNSCNNESPASPYQCQWSDGARSCGAVVAHNRIAISHHLQTEHAIRVKADQTSQNCRWGKCRKTMRRESLPRHILAVHMKETVWCTDCDSRFARTDSLQRHQRTCCSAKGDKV